MNTEPTQRRSKDARSTGTRDRLLAAAREVLASRGVAGATSREITDTAEANLASITYHFGSKDELVAAALLAEIEELVEPALLALEDDTDPTARLLEAVQLLFQTFATKRQRVPLYFEAVAAELRSGHGSTGTLLAKVRARLATVIESLQHQGAISAWVDPDSMSALIVASAQGLVLQSALDPTGPSAEQQASQFARLLLEARN
jgi:AcrR family transcriptional regulator